MASERGLEPEPVEEEVAAILDQFLGSPLPERLARLALIGREIPVLHPRDGLLVQGIADLLYRDPDSTVVVADYKTDLASPAGLPLLVARYRPQLAAYLEALRAVLPPGTPSRAELWFIRLRKVVVIPG